MNDTFLSNITRSQKTCYFISPHYDDAVLSAGALATYLKKYNRIVVINIFTSAGQRPYTLSAKAFLKQCDYRDAQLLYKDRTEEDGLALSGFADQVINLGFTEALWRPRTGRLAKYFGKLLPELGVIYPTYRFHIIRGKIARADRRTIADIKQQLAHLIDPAQAIVFCPLGVGNHIDHIVTRAACDELFESPIHWADYPYTLDSANDAKASGTKNVFSKQQKQKRALIERYQSQYKALFPDTLELQPETFYTP